MDPDNRNIGDLLNAQGVSWGWFQGGFADCAASHTDAGGVVSKDYIPHHEPFQYYASTANPDHTPSDVDRPRSDTPDPANHQYDLTDFWSAVDASSLPSVSFLKAAAYQDGHAGYSTPLDEQRFLVETINRLQKYAAVEEHRRRHRLRRQRRLVRPPDVARSSTSPREAELTR